MKGTLISGAVLAGWIAIAPVFQRMAGSSIFAWSGYGVTLVGLAAITWGLFREADRLCTTGAVVAAVGLLSVVVSLAR